MSQAQERAEAVPISPLTLTTSNLPLPLDPDVSHVDSFAPRNAIHVSPASSTPSEPTTSASSPPSQSTPPQISAISPEPEPDAWRSELHHALNLVPLWIVTVLAFVAIVVLVAVSHSNHGIMRVNDSQRTVGQISVGPKIGWTTLPGILFNLYNLWLAATVHALATREPYVELKNTEGGALASNSILLDYNAYMGITAWYRALFRHRHRLLGVCMLLQLVFGFVAGPFGASLLTASVISLKRDVMTSQQSVFNDDGLSGIANLRPALDTTSSTQFYGGKPPPWVQPFHGFSDIAAPELPHGTAGDSNWTVNAVSRSVSLACAPLDEGAFTIKNEDTGLTLSFTDRGCELDLPLANPSVKGYQYYVPTFSKTDCGPGVNGTRLVVLAASKTDDSKSLTNYSGTSCTTAYYESSGKLSITFTSAEGPSNPIIKSFNTTNNTLLDPRPLYANTLEFTLNQPSSFDNSATISASDFGRLVLNYAQKQHPNSFLTGAALKNATEQIYSAIFPLVVRQYLLQPSSSPSPSASIQTTPDPALQRQGTLATNQTRLVVVLPVAIVLLVFLALIAVEVAWAWWYVCNKPAALYEEPCGLLSAAGMLNGSDLAEEVKGLGEGVVGSGSMGSGSGAAALVQVRKVWERDEDDKGLKDSRWAFRNLGGAVEEGRLVRVS